MNGNKLVSRAVNAALCGTLAAIVASPASAQDAGTTVGLEEVIVTATRRDTSLQETPISISALTEDFLTKNGFDDMDGWAKAIPSFDYTKAVAGAGRYTVRGISSRANEATSGASEVGTYFDDISITAGQFNEADVKSFDIERIEVLKGPQGTLYGEGSMGGTLRIISKKPNLQRFEARAAASVASTRDAGDLTYAGDAMLNLPLLEGKLALRVVGSYRDEAGYIDNTSLGIRDFDEEKARSGRVTVLWQPTEKLSVSGAFHYGELESPARHSSTPGLTQSQTLGEGRTEDSELISLTVEYRLPWATITSATGYNDRDSLSFFELTTLTGVFNQIASSFGAGPYDTVSADLKVDTRTFTQEVRLVSNGNGPLQWTGGAYYKEFARPIGQELTTRPDSSSALAAALGPGASWFLFDGNPSYEQWAVFGELSYRFANRLTMGIGARYTDETIKQPDTIVNYGILVGVPTPPPPGSVPAIEDSFTKLTPKLFASYEYSDDVLLYGTAAQGYRRGGRNDLPPGTPPDIPTQFRPESVWSYELGAKTTWSEKRVLLNGAIFYSDWKDTQVVGGIPPANQLRFISNIGSAHTFGIEGEFRAVVGSGVEVGLSGNWIEAEIDQDTPAFPLLGGFTVAAEGSKLPYVPKYKLAADVSYTKPLNNGLEFSLRGSASKTGERFNSITNLRDPVARELIQGFDEFGLRASLRGANWSATLFCDNCGDSRGQQETDPRFVDQYVYIRPRTIGLSFDYAFGSKGQ